MAAERSGTAAKALGLLEILGSCPDGATASDVSHAAEIPLSTAYRLLNTLVDTGYAEYEADQKRYRLGLRIYQLGQKVAHARGFAGTAIPILRRLTALTRESSIFHVLHDGQSLTVHKVDGPQFRTTTDPGDKVPLHTSASGKVLLAFSSRETSAALVSALDLAPRTAASMTDRQALSRQLEEIRQQGWAGQSEENDPGMAAIAVPVQSGLLIGALTLAAPVFRAGISELERHLPSLQEAAERLSLLLPQRY
ncbi:IclR family transcriptional regulator [Arthrobacter sp. NPDC055585]